MGKKILSAENSQKELRGGALVFRKSVKSSGRNLPLKISHNGQYLPLKTLFFKFSQRHFSAVFLDTTSMDTRL